MSAGAAHAHTRQKDDKDTFCNILLQESIANYGPYLHVDMARTQYSSAQVSHLSPFQIRGAFDSTPAHLDMVGG